MPLKRDSGVAWVKPKKELTCAAARSERGARRGRAGALGQPGDGLGGRGVHRARGQGASSRRGLGGVPAAQLLPLLHPAEKRRVLRRRRQQQAP